MELDKELTVKQRLMKFISYKNLSQSKFEKIINAGNGFVNNISKGIGAAKLQSILCNFPDLNADWLIYGEGEMIHSSTESNELPEQLYSIIPLLPVSAQGGKLNDFIVSVKDSDCEKVVSPIRGADFAMPVAGDSMAPEYPNGSQVHIKKINEKAFIEWGKVYVLDTCNGTVIKRLVPSDKEDYIRCLSINTDPIYAPFEIFLGDIYGIYKVMLCLSIK